MVMTSREGVIKFSLDYRTGPAPAAGLLPQLEAWRSIFRRLGLLGQDPDRYDGLGFGNLSRRLPDRIDNAFLISGTQTGARQQLLPEHYVTVEACTPETNQVRARGPVKPSSEALSHGVLYQASPNIHWVMHLHCPEIFAWRTALDLPGTDPAAAYGTPAMATEIRRLALQRDLADAHLIVMTGHADGILAFGKTATATGSLVIGTLARALALGLPAEFW